MSLALARWLLRRRKRQLEHLVRRDDYELRRSRELDRIIAALEALG